MSKKTMKEIAEQIAFDIWGVSVNDIDYYTTELQTLTTVINCASLFAKDIIDEHIDINEEKEKKIIQTVNQNYDIKLAILANAYLEAQDTILKKVLYTVLKKKAKRSKDHSWLQEYLDDFLVKREEKLNSSVDTEVIYESNKLVISITYKFGKVILQDRVKDTTYILNLRYNKDKGVTIFPFR